MILSKLTNIKIVSKLAKTNFHFKGFVPAHHRQDLKRNVIKR